MGQYLPDLRLLVLAVAVRRAQPCWRRKLLGPPQPHRRQVGALRVRHRPEPRAARALPGALLPGRDDLHRLRHRDHLPVPVRHRVPRARRRSASVAIVIFAAAVFESFVYLIGNGALDWGPVKRLRRGRRRRRRRAPRRRPSGGSASRVASRPTGRRPGERGGLMATEGGFLDDGLEGLNHNFLTGTLEDLVKWARGPQRDAGHLRPGLLRHRDDGDRRPALRPRPLRHGGLPGLAPPGRPHDRRRPGVPEDGAGAAPDLRPDDGTQVGHLDGRVRVERAACSTTTPSCRASTRSCPSTSTPRAARPAPRRSCTPSSRCTSQIRDRRAHPPPPGEGAGVVIEQRDGQPRRGRARRPAAPGRAG